MQLDPQNTAAVILCGGAGKRLQGADKGLLQYKNRALVEWVIDALQPSVSEIIISANRNIETYEKLGHPVVQDQTAEHQGPLAGLVASLTTLLPRSEIQAVMISSCDTPNLNPTIYKRLRGALNSNANIAIAYDGHRKQNLHCVVHRKAWASLFDFFNQGGRAVHRWQTIAGATEVNFSDQADCFLNINTVNPNSDQALEI